MTRRVLEYAIVAAGILLNVFLDSSCVIGGVFCGCLAKLYSMQKRLPQNDLRPDADAGLWMVLCIPWAILTVASRTNHGGHWPLLEMLSAFLLFLSFGKIGPHPRSPQWLWLPASVFAFFVCPYNIWKVAVSVAVSSQVFHLTFECLVKNAAKSFTLGEVVTMAQAVAIVIPTSIVTISEVEAPSALLQAALLYVSGVVALTFYVESIRKSLRTFLTFLIVSGITVAYPLAFLSVGSEPVGFLIEFLASSCLRLALLGGWAAMTVAACAFSHLSGRFAEVSTTTIRKVFHLFVVLVYTSGAVFDPEMTYLASGLILAVFLLVETIRAARLDPIASMIQDSFKTFLDAKDQGSLIMSHVYLLLGCSLPFFLHPDLSSGHTQALLTGVTALGIGDTCAAVFGKRFGRLRWPGTAKTFEGTLASFLSQLMFCSLFMPESVGFYYFYLLTAILLLSSCLEATTEQNDNLCVPLFTFPLMLSLQKGSHWFQ